MNNIRIKRQPIARQLCSFGLTTLVGLMMLAGCSQAPPKNPISANDPGGLGSPQDRLKMLDANTEMDPRLKAKKRAIIMDEINGTHTAFGHPHQ